MKELKVNGLLPWLTAIFCRRHYKVKFDIDPGYVFLTAFKICPLANLIRCSECKKTSLTSLCVMRYTLYEFFVFPLFIICNVEEKKKILTCPES